MFSVKYKYIYIFITVFLTSRLSSHWLWKERRGCLLLAVLNSSSCSFCHVLHHWSRLYSILHVYFDSLVCLPLLCTAQTNIFLSDWPHPFHHVTVFSLVEHFLVAEAFQLHPMSLCTIFLIYRCIFFVLILKFFYIMD